MNPRSADLIGGFNRGAGEYALARLEFAMRFHERAAPPLLSGLPAAAATSLGERWDAVEAQLSAVLAYLKQVEGACGTDERADPAFRRLRRTVRELDQYARALRWVLAVGDGDAAR
ncbi:MAG: hypothetical protein JOZ24_01440 [Candidatus Eremiobacteraeota bacterium]|nr:hypothetical protein [Candidatus Eremiobacteraeota bacterium]